MNKDKKLIANKSYSSKVSINNFTKILKEKHSHSTSKKGSNTNSAENLLYTVKKNISLEKFLPHDKNGKCSHQQNKSSTIQKNKILYDHSNPNNRIFQIRNIYTSSKIKDLFKRNQNDENINNISNLNNIYQFSSHTNTNISSINSSIINNTNNAYSGNLFKKKLYNVCKQTIPSHLHKLKKSSSKKINKSNNISKCCLDILDKNINHKYSNTKKLKNYPKSNVLTLNDDNDLFNETTLNSKSVSPYQFDSSHTHNIHKINIIDDISEIKDISNFNQLTIQNNIITDSNININYVNNETSSSNQIPNAVNSTKIIYYKSIPTSQNKIVQYKMKNGKFNLNNLNDVSNMNNKSGFINQKIVGKQQPGLKYKKGKIINNLSNISLGNITLSLNKSNKINSNEFFTQINTRKNSKEKNICISGNGQTNTNLSNQSNKSNKSKSNNISSYCINTNSNANCKANQKLKMHTKSTSKAKLSIITDLDKHITLNKTKKNNKSTNKIKPFKIKDISDIPNIKDLLNLNMSKEKKKYLYTNINTQSNVNTKTNLNSNNISHKYNNNNSKYKNKKINLSQLKNNNSTKNTSSMSNKSAKKNENDYLCKKIGINKNKGSSVTKEVIKNNSKNDLSSLNNSNCNVNTHFHRISANKNLQIFANNKKEERKLLNDSNIKANNNILNDSKKKYITTHPSPKPLETSNYLSNKISYKNLLQAYNRKYLNNKLKPNYKKINLDVLNYKSGKQNLVQSKKKVNANVIKANNSSNKLKRGNSKEGSKKNDGIKNGNDSNLNNTFSSIQSNLKDANYFQNEKAKVINFINQYYQVNGVYPSSKPNFYKYGRLIGKGAFGKVNLALHLCSGKLVAIKTINKSNLKEPNSKEKVKQEIEILKTLHHPFVTHILDTFEDEKYIFIVMEYTCDELLNYISKRTKLSENVAKALFKQLIEGIQYIHSKNIVHRDIKLDNILIDLTNTIKICDFGVSRSITSKDVMHEHCGTPAYIAPEIFQNNGYKGFSCDIWSAGVTLYYMLSGNQPFKGTNMTKLHENIMHEPLEPIENASNEVMNLISGMLEINPKKRLTIEQILNHPWLAGVNTNNRSNLNLFTFAEKVNFSKFDVNYLEDEKQNLIENFTIKNLITVDSDRLNQNSKSIILAPYNSFVSSNTNNIDNNLNSPSSQNMQNDSSLISPNLKIENSLCKFGGFVRQDNLKYELNNNQDFDNGFIISQEEDDVFEEQEHKDVESISKENDNLESISGNYLLMNNDAVSIITSLSLQNSENISTGNLRSMEKIYNSEIIKEIETNIGYKGDYLVKCLKDNAANYATATYYLLEIDMELRKNNTNNNS